MILYSSQSCPQCQFLKKLLDEKKIAYTTISDPEILRAKGIISIPQLETENRLMNFQQALKWAREAE